jgi:predicted nucleic acid-binding protein
VENIAATALQHGLAIVTRDTDDFLRARAAVFNPWTGSVAAGSGKRKR